VELLKKSPTKFSLSFLNIPTSLYEFWKFDLIFGNFIKSKGKKKTKPGAGPGFGPRPSASWDSGLRC
jgi:hypothetical protein